MGQPPAAMSAKSPALSHRTREGQGTRIWCVERMGQPPSRLSPNLFPQPAKPNNHAARIRFVKAVSQKTIVEMKRVLGTIVNRHLNYGDLLYERDFPDWFVIRGAQTYSWDWTAMLVELRRGAFFFVQDITGWQTCIVSDHPSLTREQAKLLGEAYTQRLAAFATSLPGSESLLRSLQLDGFEVNKEKLMLVPLEGPVSAAEEEDRITKLARTSGIPESVLVLKHMADAHSLYTEGKYHSSLNESRNLIQALIDGISVETDRHAKHSPALPGGAANRVDYLSKVGFFTPDEKAALLSGWGSLSAGSHPGVPEREQARIGLILAFEFAQLLMLKFTNWRTNAYRAFS